MRTRDVIERARSDSQSGRRLARDRRCNRIYRCVKRERSACDARRLVVPVMQIDAASLGVRYRAGFIAGKRERRARYADLTGNGQGHCEQAQAPHRAASQRASELHVVSKLALRDQKAKRFAVQDASVSSSESSTNAFDYVTRGRTSRSSTGLRGRPLRCWLSFRGIYDPG